MIDESTNMVCSDSRLIEEFRSHLRTDGNYVVTRAGEDLFGRKQHDRIPFRKLLQDWHSHVSDAHVALDYALGRTHPVESRYSQQSVKIMKLMGWTPGEGLGERSDGRTNPIPTPPPSGGKGRGSRGLGGGQRTRGHGGDRGGDGTSKGPTFLGHEPVPGTLVFGKPGNRDGAEVLEVWDVTPRGTPYRTSRVVYLEGMWDTPRRPEGTNHLGRWACGDSRDALPSPTRLEISSLNQQIHTRERDR